MQIFKKEKKKNQATVTQAAQTQRSAVPTEEPEQIPTAHGTLHKPLRATRYTAGTTAYGSTFNTAYQTPILANKIYSWDGGWNEAQKWKHVL